LTTKIVKQQLEIKSGTRLPKPVLIATCGKDRKLYKTVEPDETGYTTVVRFGLVQRYAGPIGYIDYDGKISTEEPTLTSIKMSPYWDFLNEADKHLW
jgi:hypothetical protein